MQQFNLPNLHEMNDSQVRAWVASLTTEVVYQYLTPITEAIMDRMGPSARVSTSTYQPPKIVHLIDTRAG